MSIRSFAGLAYIEEQVMVCQYMSKTRSSQMLLNACQSSSYPHIAKVNIQIPANAVEMSLPAGIPSSSDDETSLKFLARVAL